MSTSSGVNLGQFVHICTFILVQEEYLDEAGCYLYNDDGCKGHVLIELKLGHVF